MLGKIEAEDRKIIEEAINKGRAEIIKDEITYVRFKNKFKKFERGTVITTGQIIPGYPHIKRIFYLKTGLKNIKSKKIYVEEKIDGYNIRIAKIKNNIYAFSRGGFLDLFATEKINETHLPKFFEKYPEYILCGEMIGCTPYTKPTKNYEVNLYIFDILNNGKRTGPKEKRKLLNKEKIPQPPLFGISSEYKELKKIVLRANKSKSEGIILRGEKGEVLKYVCAKSDILAINETIKLFFDLPTGFINQRILRSALFIEEHRLNREKYEKILGAAIYSLIESLKEEIAEEFQIKIKNRKIWDQIIKHMSKEIEVKIINEWEREGYRYIVFKKIYKKTNKKIRQLLSGKAFVD